MGAIKEIWHNKWFRFTAVTLIYTAWFVLWTRNPWWLLGIPVIYDFYISQYIHRLFLDKYRAFKAAHKGFKHIIEWVEALLFAVVVVVPLKLYFFGLYVIPSSSMENTLLIGDYIFVDRLAYGPKMPITPLAFPFVQNTLPLTEDTPSYVDWIQYKYKRLAGYTTPKAGDVVVFNFPEGDTVALIAPTNSYYEIVRAYGRETVYQQSKVLFRPVDKRENYIKRCTAIAGDSIQVIGDTVYVNGKLSPIPPHLIIEPETTIEQPTTAIFPHRPDLYPWTHRDFGPIWVPKAGATVTLSLDNLPLYERIIKNYELNALEVRDSTILINGQVATQYTFRMDYYFMMGDNRDNSLDSRYWGFVPEDHIEGKAALVWMSITPGKNIFNGLRFDRMFRSIQ